MTLEELDQKFPNGLDAAEILSINIDYHERVVAFQLSFRRNSPEGPDRNEYSEGTLRVIGFYYFSIEPPDPDHVSNENRRKILVDGLPEDGRRFPLFEHVKPTLPPGAFSCRFYVHDWNSFIRIAAADAKLA